MKGSVGGLLFMFGVGLFVWGILGFSGSERSGYGFGGGARLAGTFGAMLLVAGYWIYKRAK